jgi:hypothetical protein
MNELAEKINREGDHHSSLSGTLRDLVRLARFHNFTRETTFFDSDLEVRF